MDGGASGLLGGLASLFDKGQDASLLGGYDGSGIRGGAGGDTLGGGTNGDTLENDPLFDKNNPLSITQGQDYNAPGWGWTATPPSRDQPGIPGAPNLTDKQNILPDMGLPGNEGWPGDKDSFPGAAMPSGLLSPDPNAITGEGGSEYPASAGGGGPLDDGKNPGFFSQMFGGSKRDKLGTLLMGLGGGMMTAAGDVQGGGTRGIQEGLQNAGQAIDRQNEQANEEDYRKQVLQLRRDELNKPAADPELLRLYQAAKKEGYKGSLPDFIQLEKGGGEGTANQRDYIEAVRGGYKGSFFDYQMEMKKAGANQTIFSGENELSKSLGKAAGDMVIDSNKAISQSQQNLRDLREMNNYNENPKVYKGPFADPVHRIKQTAEILGIPVEGTGPEQQWRSISSKLALATRSTSEGGGLPGSMSDADRNFVVAIQPGVQNTPSGNRLMIKIGQRRERFRIDYNMEQQRYIMEHKGVDGLPENMEAWSQKHDYLADLENDPDTGEALRIGGGNDGSGRIRRWDDPD